jgi:hypothetical protein
MNLTTALQSEKIGGRDRVRTCDPCLQSIRLDSIRSIHYFQLLKFPTNRGTCFSLKAIPNAIKTLDSCTVRAQWTSSSIPSQVSAVFERVLQSGTYPTRPTANTLKIAVTIP